MEVIEGFQVGMRVRAMDPVGKGTVKWMGHRKGDLVLGLEMDKAADWYTGNSFGAETYFTCRQRRGHIVAAGTCIPLNKPVERKPDSGDRASDSENQPACIPLSNKEKVLEFVRKVESIDGTRPKAPVYTGLASLQRVTPETCTAAELNTDLDIDSMVELRGKHQYGLVKWLGRYGDKPVVGIELEEVHPMGNDGAFFGHKIFNCEPGRALFVRLEAVIPDTRFSGLMAEGIPRFSESVRTRVPAPSEVADTSKICGRWKGIQGHHNSSYLDATVYAMFAFCDIFDEDLERSTVAASDIEAHMKIQMILGEDIVYPLRRDNYVDATKVLELRHVLDTVGPVKGLTHEQQGPEDFLKCLLEESLQCPPFLKFSNGNDGYYYQVFLENTPKLELPSTQQLVELSFYQADIQLTKMPRFGKSFRLYEKIIPSLELDITDILTTTFRECAVCSQNAGVVGCRDCFKSSLRDTVFCAECNGRWHKHRKRKAHQFRDIRNRSAEPGALAPPFPRHVMELVAVICIQTSHYVSFVRCGTDAHAPWVFFDSMADRVGDENGYNIPEVTRVDDFLWWLSEDGKRSILQGCELREHIKRLMSDGYMSLYRPAGFCKAQEPRHGVRTALRDDRQPKVEPPSPQSKLSQKQPAEKSRVVSVRKARKPRHGVRTALRDDRQPKVEPPSPQSKLSQKQPAEKSRISLLTSQETCGRKAADARFSDNVLTDCKPEQPRQSVKTALCDDQQSKVKVPSPQSKLSQKQPAEKSRVSLLTSEETCGRKVADARFSDNVLTDCKPEQPLQSVGTALCDDQHSKVEPLLPQTKLSQKQPAEKSAVSLLKSQETCGGKVADTRLSDSVLTDRKPEQSPQSVRTALRDDQHSEVEPLLPQTKLSQKQPAEKSSVSLLKSQETCEGKVADTRLSDSVLTDHKPEQSPQSVRTALRDGQHSEVEPLLPQTKLSQKQPAEKSSVSLLKSQETCEGKVADTRLSDSVLTDHKPEQSPQSVRTALCDDQHSEVKPPSPQSKLSQKQPAEKSRVSLLTPEETCGREDHAAAASETSHSKQSILESIDPREYGTKFRIGSTVKITTQMIRYGEIKWMGKNHDKLIVGLEMEPPDSNDGDFLGQKLFECSPGTGLFASLDSCRPDDRRIMKPQQQKSESSERTGIELVSQTAEDLQLDYEIGSRIKLKSGCCCTVRWLGCTAGKTKPIIGVELDEDTPRGTDGTWTDGQRYFKCPPKRGMFVRPNACLTPPCVHTRKSLPLVGEPSVTLELDPSVTCGSWKGIQGSDITYNLESVLYPLFAYHQNLDEALQRPSNAEDEETHEVMQWVLRENIVNPLRQSFYVSADHVEKLLTLIDTVRSLDGLFDNETDPAKHITFLLENILGIKPLLSFRNGHKCSCYPLELKRFRQHEVPTVHQLLEESLFEKSLLMTKRPDCLLLHTVASGQSEDAYSHIRPSLILDVTSVIQSGSRACRVCGGPAIVECRSCFQDFPDSCLQDIFFCASCNLTWHSNADRQGNNPVSLKVTPRVLDGEHPPRRQYMELFAVITRDKARDQYVSYVKCGNTSDWLCMDGKKEKIDGKRGTFYIPAVHVCEALPEWLSEENNPSQASVCGPDLPEHLRPLLEDAYIYFYRPV